MASGKQCSHTACFVLRYTSIIIIINNVSFHEFLQQSVAGLSNLNLPDVCTNALEKEKAFYTALCQLLKEKASHVPLGLKDFLKHCGISQGILSLCIWSYHALIFKLAIMMLDWVAKKIIPLYRWPWQGEGSSRYYWYSHRPTEFTREFSGSVSCYLSRGILFLEWLFSYIEISYRHNYNILISTMIIGTFRFLSDNLELFNQAVYADVDAPTCRKDTSQGKKNWGSGREDISLLSVQGTHGHLAAIVQVRSATYHWQSLPQTFVLIYL